MSDSNGTDRTATPPAPTTLVRNAGAATTESALREGHAARARSAYDRAIATCRYIGVDQNDAQIVPREPAGKAANAVRLSGQALDALVETSPDPAADARCARNAAAAAAIAAQLAQSHDGGDLSLAASHAALAASRAAGNAAGGAAAGRDPLLNTAADEAEASAVACAQRAGWI